MTRADVANMAEVSPALVSYVLNGGPRPVSKAARARVLAAIDALDYRPNAVASALRGGSTKSVGLLMPSLINPYFAELADVIERTLLDAGYLLSIGITHDDPARELVHLRSLTDRRVDGLMLVASQALTTVRSIRGKSTPIVVLDRVEGGEFISSVCTDNVRDAQYAVEHLQSWGHRTIACVSGPSSIPVSRDRVEGWRIQQGRIGAPAGPDLVAHADFSAQGGADAARVLLDTQGQARRERPTGLFVTSDAQAHGVFHVCHELGLRIPEDVSIVSYDGTQSAKFAQPVLTTMRQPIQEIGSAGVRLLLEMAEGKRATPSAVVFRSNLVYGGSCAEPRN